MKTHRANKSYVSPKQIPKMLQYIHFPRIDIEKQIYYRFKTEYSNTENLYYTIIINQIISNEQTHIVAEFKDYLIHGDMSEFLQDFYLRTESKLNLPKIFEYYESCSVIFPNYVILPESKYIYKNIQQKQKVIDHQQKLEQEFEMKKAKSISISISNDDEDSDKVFDTKVFDSLLNQTNTSMICQLFGVNSKEGNTLKKEINDIEDLQKEEEEDDITLHKSINDLINTINKIEFNQQYFTNRYKRSCLKKDSVNMRYENITTTTKDKSSNGQQAPMKRKMIISNILSSDKNILMKSIKDIKNYKSARPLSNDNSHNASRLKDNKNQISSSSSKHALIMNNKINKAVSPNSHGNSSNINNSNSFTHKNYLRKLQSVPYTSRETKINTEIIQLLTSKLLQVKLTNKQTSISRFRKKHHQSNKNVSLLSTGTSSIIQKATHVYNHGKKKQKEKVYDNLYDKYERSPKIRKINHNPNMNRNRNEFACSNNKTNCVKANGMLEHQFSLSPSKQNELSAKTCTHLLSNTSFTKDKLKKVTNAVIPKKDLLIRGIKIKGFEDILKKNNSRNLNSISDRLLNKNSTQKLINGV